jgi:hypothetical protein
MTNFWVKSAIIIFATQSFFIEIRIRDGKKSGSATLLVAWCKVREIS